jgi:hypothetical protein
MNFAEKLNEKENYVFVSSLNSKIRIAYTLFSKSQ